MGRDAGGEAGREDAGGEGGREDTGEEDTGWESAGDGAMTIPLSDSTGASTSAIRRPTSRPRQPLRTPATGRMLASPPADADAGSLLDDL